jgi:PAS domain S-box-containing protein
VYNGRSTASLSLIESLTSDRDALAHEIGALRAREQLYHMLIGQLAPPYDDQRWQRMCMFEALVEGIADGILITTIDGVITYANQAFQAMMGYGEAIVGMHLNELIAHEERRFVPAVIQRLIQAGTWQGTRTYLRGDGSTFDANISLVLIRDAAGQPHSRAAIVRDLTRQRRLEQEQLLLQEQVIAAQQSQLRDLSTPVLRLAPGVIVVPLTGGVDRQRAGEIVEALLGAVARQPTATAIVDITGLAALDQPISHLLLRTAQALKLLGTQVVVTGIQTDLRISLAALGLEQLGVTFHATLQDAVDEVLGRILRRDFTTHVESL